MTSDAVEPHAEPSGAAEALPAPAASEPPPASEPPVSTVDEVASAVERARSAQRAWAALETSVRVAKLHRLKRRVLERAQTIAETIRDEVGKPLEEALLAEVLPTADLVDYWVASAEELLEGADITLDPLAFPGKTGRVHRDPRGVVALIAPYNYPFAIPLRTLLPALAAGNAVVLKPSEIAPKTGALLASMFHGVLPDGLVSIVSCDRETGARLVDADVDLVVFTGSVATGRRIAERCASRLLPCSLELGGKDAAIVLEDANLERTTNGLVWGAFTNAGQNCASIERVYVVEGIAQKLIDKIVAATRALGEADRGRLATDAQAALVRRHLDDAVRAGGEILVGGATEADGRAIPPTIVKLADGVKTELLEDETFGPVLPIVVVANEEIAIARANASRFGLTTSVWTSSTERADELARKLVAGVVTINNHGFTAAVPSAPWVGTRESGTGVTNGPHALAELTRPRLVLVDRSSAKRELWWYPYTPTLRALALEMAKARGGAGFFGKIGAFVRALAKLAKRLFE